MLMLRGARMADAALGRGFITGFINHLGIN